MICHRRCVDRIRTEQADTNRQRKVTLSSADVPFDEVAEQVEGRLEAEHVTECLDGLTELQREAITLAYYGGHTYREVATVLNSPLSTVKPGCVTDWLGCGTA